MTKNNSWNMDDDRVVLTDTTQTITGDKEFLGVVEVPVPLTPNEAVPLSFLQGNALSLVKNIVFTGPPVAALDFTNIGTYDQFLMIFHGITPDTNNAALQLLASIDNGSTWLGGTTYGNERIASNSGSLSGIGQINQPVAQISGGMSNSVPGATGYIFFPSLRNNGRKMYNSSVFYISNTATTIWYSTGGYINDLNPVNALRFQLSSGLITSAIKITLWGGVA